VLGEVQRFAHQMPSHGYEKWRLVQFFYQGLSQPNRSMIESMNGGAFLNLTGDLRDLLRFLSKSGSKGVNSKFNDRRPCIH
jgi:hypothetical protein